MAEALFRARLQETKEDWRSWRIESAGSWAEPGLPVSPEAQQTMQRRGLDISKHRSTPVTAQLLEGFNLILTMETGQKEGMRVEFPRFASRLYLLSEMNGEFVTIRDPYGGTPQDYEAIADEIDRRLVNGMERIIRLADDTGRLGRLLQGARNT